MMSQKILTLAIDLGATNTGVYSSYYNKGDNLNNVHHKKGVVYNLSQNAYTLLMNKRTEKRHQRRGIDRKQLVKRLFKLIWVQQLKLEWSDNIQQAISFLLNRRGFSFLTEQYSTDVLANTPQNVVDVLPESLHISDEYIVINGDEVAYDLNPVLTELIKDTPKLNSLISKIRQNIFLCTVKKICQQKLTTSKSVEVNKDTNRLSQLTASDFNLIKDILVNIDSIEIDEFSYTNKDQEVKLARYYWNNKYNLLQFINDKYDQDSLKLVIEKIEPLNLDDEVWDFNPDPDTKFELDKEKNLQDLENQNIKAHLHHLTFALYNIKNELDSGSRHRSKYFEEVHSVLSENNHHEPYLKEFCTKLHNGTFNNLKIEELTNLIGNLSNLELKPLRKYFNDEQHAKGDYWKEDRFANVYCNWILNEWRVGSQDKDKQRGKKYCYTNLCKNLRHKINASNYSIIEFLMELDPCNTIPPYQDNNNRKPPKCQSLILNPHFLDMHYPKWQDYLRSLQNLQEVKDYLADYVNEIRSLKTSKGQFYFVETKHQNKQMASGQRDTKDLNARVLQFIFDKVKANDDLLLNEIYSLAKKIKQPTSNQREMEEYTQKLNQALDRSNLPDSLKSEHNNGVFLQGEFLHLVCKYFKYRQRARDSRIYIMPEYNYDSKQRKWNNTERFDDDNHILTYCNHKPRQKRYQLLNDLARVLQVSPTMLREKIGSDQESDIINWLKEFKLASYCKSAVELQKLHRGSLNQKIETAIFKDKIETIRKNKKATDDEKLLLIKYSKTTKPNKEEDNLVKLVKNINATCQKIGESLELNETQISKFNSIYSFAQIHQIAFVERTGNASTCPVCSLDNAHRMQTINDGAKAQRLAAIPTRVIDGAVKKMVTILAKNIVNDNWDFVKEALSNNHNIHIPIITESNSFEFEPSLAKLKGTNLKDKRKKSLDNAKPENVFKQRDDRIKSNSCNISAYSGSVLSSQTELDHIIPRSSQYGVLNDEANLICVNSEDNQRKGNQQYYLTNLADNYKHAMFGTNNNDQIKDWISKIIWDDEKKDFKFKNGNYHNFINLSYDEQKAFRHALFLANDNEIKQAVIKAINNRNRTFVNGTQRYFAEVLANAFYLRAKQEKLNTAKISFDYFGVETTNQAGTGIANIRKFYEDYDYANIVEYKKNDNSQQKPYSHLIDAMFAFCIAVNAHKNDGSIGIKIDDEINLFPVDTSSGEMLNDIFSQIRVTDNQFTGTKLNRKKATEGFNNHRQITRDGIYAEKYLPILVHKTLNEVRKGFTWINSEEIKLYKGKKLDIQQLNNILFLIRFIAEDLYMESKVETLNDLKNILEQNNVPSTSEYFYINLKTQLVHKYYLENYNTSLGYKEYSSEMKFLRSIAYKIEHKRINNIDDVKSTLDKQSNFSIGAISLPFKAEWQKLLDKWNDTDIKHEHAFLANYFNIQNNSNMHHKTRKAFSLPVLTAEGKILIQRKNWQGNYVYQILNDSDSRNDGTKPFIVTFNAKEKTQGKAIVSSFISENIMWLADNKKYESLTDKDIAPIDNSEWFKVEVPLEVQNALSINSLYYRIDDNTRPSVRVSLNEHLTDAQIKAFLANPLFKARNKDDVYKDLSQGEKNLEYKGDGFNKLIHELLTKQLSDFYHETPDN